MGPPALLHSDPCPDTSLLGASVKERSHSNNAHIHIQKRDLVPLENNDRNSCIPFPRFQKEHYTNMKMQHDERLIFFSQLEVQVHDPDVKRRKF